MPEQKLATKQDLNDLKQDMREFKDEMIHQFKIIAEGLRDDIKIIAEGHQMLVEKEDRLEQKMDRVEQKVDYMNLEVKAIGNDLNDHRNNTETHIVKPKSKRKI